MFVACLEWWRQAARRWLRALGWTERRLWRNAGGRCVGMEWVEPCWVFAEIGIKDVGLECRGVRRTVHKWRGAEARKD